MSRTTSPPRLRRAGEPIGLLTKVLAALTAVIIVAPVGYLIYGAFSTGYPGEQASHLTVQWLHDVYATRRYLPALGWSVAIATVSSTLATAVGGAFAWLLWRIDVPFRGAWQGVVMVGFVLPPVLATMAWISLLAPHGGGLLNVWFNDLTGAGDLFNIYSYAGIVITTTFVFAPLAFLLASSAFASADFSDEEAARIHGANLWTTMWRVTFPAVRLSLAVAWVLVFSVSAQSFSAVLILGPPAHVQTIPELMYEAVTANSSSLGEVTMLSTMLLWPALAGFVWLILGDRRGTVLRGRISSRRGNWSLGRFRWPVLIVFGLYLLVSTVLPIVAVVLNSFFKYQTGHLSMDLFTLANYRGAFGNPEITSALWHSVELGFGSATVGVALSFLLAYEQVRTPDSFLGRAIQMVTALPLALPRLGLSLGFLWVTTAIPPLRSSSGSLVMIGITIVVANVGFGTRTLAAEMGQIPKSLDESARLSGANRLSRELRITAPMVARGMVNVWRTYLVLALLEIDLLVFVYLPNTETLSIRTLLSLSEGLINTAYPLAVLQLALAAVALGLASVFAALLGRSGKAVDVTAAVEVTHLRKSYKGVTAVDDVTLGVADGETLVLLGPSGCGKTTILRCIAGLESPTGGRIVLGGTVVADPAPRVEPEKRGVGMVFQSYALWPHLTVLENVVFACRKGARLGKQEAHVEAREQLERFGLAELESRMPSELSGGQQQRVALARAIASRPRVLLMDEPLSALDQQLREELRAGLKASIVATGLACVYVTHDQPEAMAMADQVAVLQAGRVVELGAPRALYAKPRSLFGARFLGARNVVGAAEIVGPAAGGHLLARKGRNTFEFSVADPGWSPVAGDRVDIAWRPEAATIVRNRQENSNQCVEGRVQGVIFLGGTTQVQVELATGEMVAASLAEDPVDVGDSCFVSVEPKEMLGYALD